MSGRSVDEEFRFLFTETLSEYRRRLQLSCSALVQHPEVWAECREQALGILEECAQALRGEAPTVVADRVQFSVQLGGRRALLQVPAAESLAAARVLTGLVLEAVDRALGDLPPDLAYPLLRRAVHMVNLSVYTRVYAAGVGYDAFVLQQVGEANAENRRRLARDLHDHLGSDLSVVLHSLDLHEAQAPGCPGRRLTDARKAVDHALDFVRTLVRDLRVGPDSGRLEAVLRAFAEAAAPEAVQVRVDVNGDEDWLPDDYRDQLFLVVRECLRNTFAHAGAATAAVSLNIAPHALEATVEDDGCGVDLDSPALWRGGGLTAMRERVAELGGTLRLHGSPGGGTRVWVRVPLPGLAPEGVVA